MYTDVATQPRDDDYTQATDISLDQQNTESLAGATEADGELLACGDASTARPAGSASRRLRSGP